MLITLAAKDGLAGGEVDAGDALAGTLGAQALLGFRVWQSGDSWGTYGLTAHRSSFWIRRGSPAKPNISALSK